MNRFAGFLNDNFTAIAQKLPVLAVWGRTFDFLVRKIEEGL